ncbi:MAG: hypothetical protein KH544_11360 [Firmicutes bacterium]|nr:hypothetical protein [Bacillota bacterium]
MNRVIPGNGIGPYESGSVTINDGTVKATAKGEGFGIGGARIYNTGAMTVTINGGTIEATANRNNAAIGDRGKGKSGVTITDGVIHATGKGGAAGIGSKDDIRITGGELTVSAEGSGAAIGGFTDTRRAGSSPSETAALHPRTHSPFSPMGSAWAAIASSSLKKARSGCRI